MARPAPFDALDAALAEHLARLERAEVEVQRVHDENIAELDRIQGLLDAARKERVEAYYDARNCEAAIRRLGFAVVDPRDGSVVAKDASLLEEHDYSPFRDLEAARQRAAARAVEAGDVHDG